MFSILLLIAIFCLHPQQLGSQEPIVGSLYPSFSTTCNLSGYILSNTNKELRRLLTSQLTI
ncbi:hypothetical protein CPB83DRAFT_858063 [Crepidotus variabilis]|uniref:Uncharacterized protein n=1 Tax=Crepidotus variabilis TaxID=179855 RepID=A0A9P6EBV8_9AGAR|nr:hypothetical protein CPB83DRAFT_858063 [Crepidotus variabilis]